MRRILVLCLIMNCTAVIAQDTIRIFIDDEGFSTKRFKGIRLRSIQVDNVFLIANEVCVPFNKLDEYHFQLIKKRSDICEYEILLDSKEVKFIIKIEQYWCEISNLNISAYSYRHWKNRFKIKYGFLVGNSWQGMNFHVEPSSFDCIRIEDGK